VTDEDELQDQTGAPSSSPVGRGQVLEERYAVKSSIGQGRFSTVHLGQCLRTGKPCAIKAIFKGTRCERDAAYCEAQTLQAVTHHGVNRLVDVIEDQCNVYLVLEHVDGQDLFEYLRDMGCMSEQEAAQIIQQVLQALAHCHQENIVHRDIKCENIMVHRRSSSGLPPKVTLIDFGLAIPGGAALEGGMEGSVPYLAPELAGLCICHASQDLWSAGVVLFAMLTGELPSSQVSSGAAALQLPAQFSEEAQSFLAGIMHPEASERMSAQEASEHPWLKRVV